MVMDRLHTGRNKKREREANIDKWNIHRVAYNHRLRLVQHSSNENNSQEEGYPLFVGVIYVISVIVNCSVDIFFVH